MRHQKVSYDLLEPFLGATEGVPPSAKDEDADLEYHRMCKAIHRILMGDDLTPRQKQCVQLYYFEGMKIQEIADLIGIHASTVSRHIRKGKNQIMKIMRYSFDRLQ